MTDYVIAIAAILILLLAWVVVERVYRLFARRNPELGPFRQERGGCGCCSGGACGGGACSTKD